MLSTVYTLLFLISFVYLFVITTVFRKNVSVYFIMLFATVLVCNFGYMQMCTAENLRLAIVANQTIYLGCSFSHFFLFMCVADMCKAKIPAGIQIIFMVLGVTIFFFVSTIGVTNLYYKSVEVIEHYGIYMLVKSYGPMHFLYLLMLSLSFTFSLFLIIRSFFCGKDISYINSLIILGLLFIEIIAYILEKISGWGIPIMPMSLVLGETVVLVLLMKISLYDITSISSDFMEQTRTSGFMLFDSRGNYLGCDEISKQWFPEINTLKVDCHIKEEGSELFLCIDDWIHGRADSDVKVITKGEKTYEVKHSVIRQIRRKAVHCVYLRDDTEQQQYTKLIESYNENLEKDVNSKTEKIKEIQQDIIISMASIVENRDNNTGGHIARTSDVVRIFVKHLISKNYNIDLKFAQNIVKAAPLHDFGKIAIPDVILNKPGKFTPEEYEVMKQHPAKGAVIVEQILRNSEDDEFRTVAVNIAHYHHEKFDGTGYPCGLKGTEIPFEARIMALADVFDALVSKRVYKDSFSFDKAFQIIEESAGKHFCPDLTVGFLECRQELEDMYNSYED